MSARLFLLLIPVALLSPGLPAADGPTAQISLAEKEKFLASAKVVKTRSPQRGITGTLRATLEDGTRKHEASIQTIDEFKPRFEGMNGTEINFKDSYRFNIAAYRLAGMLGIPMIPPSVFRKYNGTSGAFTWWVDDVIMDELDRTKNKMEPPDQDDWNAQMHIVRVFDQLIYNTDRNLGNLLIDKQWRLWMIDHSRAFRMVDSIKEEKNLQRCERTLLEKLKTLDEEQCKKELKDLVNAMEIKGMLKRRDKIVAHFEKAGPSALYSYSYRH